jgi:hypothetical protein
MGAVVARRLQAWGGGGCGGGVTGMQPGAGQPGTRWARVYGAGRAQSKNGERGRQGSERADGEEWPDDLWPDDEPARRIGGSAGGGGAGEPWPAAVNPAGVPGHGALRRRVRPGTLAVIALAAAAAGAGIVLGVVDLSSSPSATTAAPGGQPSQLAPVPPGGNGALPGAGSGGTAMIFMIGKVTAVSGTSITIGGPAHSITAAVTDSTRVTGKVSGIRGIKVGDQVSAQITQSGGRSSAIAIQDPAQPPPGGSLP